VHARLEVNPSAAAGDYAVRIHGREVPVDKVPALHIIVHKDAADHQRSSKSLIRRTLNLSPWWMIVLWAACALVIFLFVFVLSNLIDRMLADQGRAAVYLVRPEDGGQVILFAWARAMACRSACSSMSSIERDSG